MTAQAQAPIDTENKAPAEKEKLPLSASYAGKNSHYVACKPVGFRRAYSACLYIKDRLEDGKLAGNVDFALCEKAIKNGYCEAQEMRAREIEAGESLYYEERTLRAAKVEVKQPDYYSSKKIDKNSASYKRGVAQVANAGKKKLPKPLLSPEKKTTSSFFKKPVKKDKPVTQADVLAQGAKKADLTKVVNEVAKQSFDTDNSKTQKSIAPKKVEIEKPIIKVEATKPTDEPKVEKKNDAPVDMLAKARALMNK